MIITYCNEHEYNWWLQLYPQSNCVYQLEHTSIWMVPGTFDTDGVATSEIKDWIYSVFDPDL